MRIGWHRFLVLAALGTHLLWVRGAAEHDPREFEDQIRQFEATDQQTPPPERAVVFTGSSTLRNWTQLTNDFRDLPVLNRGFGGAHYSDVLHFYERIIRNYRPRAVLLYAGDNDLHAGVPVAQVYTEVTRLVARIQSDLPDTWVWIISVKPSPARLALLESQREFNEQVRKFCGNQPRVRYLDVASAMLDQTGQPRLELFGADRLHLNSSGYALWHDLIRAEIKRSPLSGRGLPSTRGLALGASLALAGLVGGAGLFVWRRTRPQPLEANA
jgi:lysophospholipase L1-like esterase